MRSTQNWDRVQLHIPIYIYTCVYFRNLQKTLPTKNLFLSFWYMSSNEHTRSNDLWNLNILFYGIIFNFFFVLFLITTSKIVHDGRRRRWQILIHDLLGEHTIIFLIFLYGYTYVGIYIIYIYEPTYTRNIIFKILIFLLFSSVLRVRPRQVLVLARWCVSDDFFFLSSYRKFEIKKQHWKKKLRVCVYT